MNIDREKAIIDIDSNIDIVKYKKTVLDNGVTIVTEEIPTVESFSIGIGLAVGSRDDSMELPGIAHFLEHSVYRRTKNRTSRQISNQFDAMGAYSNAYTTKEHTLFYVRATKKHFDKTFELLADIVVNPVFKKEEISKERQIIIEEIKSYDDDPEEFVFDLADAIVFPEHTLGNGIDGTIESLRSIDTNILSKFHSDHYIPANIFIGMSGNIKHDRVVEQAEKYFAAMPMVQSTINRTKPSTNVITKIVNKPIQQAHLILGKQTMSGLDQNRYALALLNTIFGDGLSSRIYQKLREKEGLAYTVFSSINLYNDSGSIYLYIATDRNNLQKSEDLLFDELRKLKTSKINKTELSRAKEQLKTGRILEFESMSARMQTMVKNEMLLGGYETLSQTINSIDSVGIGDLISLAETHFNESDWCKIVLLPE